MGDDREAAQSEKVGATVRVRVEALAEMARRGPDEQAADLANYFHDRAIDGYIAGNGDEYYDKNMAVSDDIANQAENAGCVVVY